MLSLAAHWVAGVLEADWRMYGMQLEHAVLQLVSAIEGPLGATEGERKLAQPEVAQIYTKCHLCPTLYSCSEFSLVGHNKESSLLYTGQIINPFLSWSNMGCVPHHSP